MNLDKYIGMPYENRGRGPESVDCWGLVRLLYTDLLGQELPSLSGQYSDSEDSGQTERTTLAEIADRWDEVSLPEFGDVVVFQMVRQASHLGMMISGTHFIHILKGRNSCIERINSLQWNKRVYGVFRLRETS